MVGLGIGNEGELKSCVLGTSKVTAGVQTNDILRFSRVVVDFAGVPALSRIFTPKVVPVENWRTRVCGQRASERANWIYSFSGLTTFRLKYCI